MTPTRTLPLLLAVSLAAACSDGSGKAPPKATPKGPEKKAEAPKPAPAEGTGFDLDALRARQAEKEASNPATAPGGSAAGNPGPAAPPPPAPTAPAKDPVAKAPEKKAEEKKEEAPPPPTSPDEISDTEVRMSWAPDERDALEQMPAEGKAKEMRKRRLEIFAKRGGVLGAADGKTEEKGPGPSGERGPARPEAQKEAPPPGLRDILDDLASRDPEIRARGAESARRFPDKTVASRHLLPFLEDPDADLRAITASVLGELKSPDSVPALEKVVERVDKDPVRAMAIKALHDIGGREARAAIRKIAREGSEPSDRAAALGMLIKMREVGEVRDLLKDALQDLSREVRHQAVTAIREFELKAFEADLFPLLQDASPQVQMETMRAFGALGSRSAVGPLVKILLKPVNEEDPDPEADHDAIQGVANDALVKITGVDQGYDNTLPDEKVKAAVDAWRVWWNKNKATWK